jgi:RimJ/RimL family protein N-acetyltransferase
MDQEFKRISTNQGELLIRPYADGDIPFHARYLFDSPKDFLETIGFDTKKLGDRAIWLEGLKARRATMDRSKVTSIVAELSGQPIAIVPLDLRYPSKGPLLHFHIFEPGLRGQGLGQLIFMAAVESYHKLYGYERFLIEPKATNVPMNKLMQKLGFRHLQDYVIAAGPVTQEFLASQYEIVVNS